MKMGDLTELVKQTFSEFQEDKASRLAAALSYYTIFSLAPLLVIVIAVAGLAFGQEAAQERIVGQIRGLVGSQESAEAVQNMIAGARNQSAGIVATIIGIATLLFGATGVFVHLQESLNTIWEVRDTTTGGVLNLLQDRFLSFTMILGIGFLLMVSLVVSAAISALDQFLTGLFPGAGLIWQVVNFVISLGVFTLLFGMIFKILPDVQIQWRDVWLGAFATALLFSIGKWLIGFYLGTQAINDTYGAAGSLIVILLWVYYSAQILFLGAEFTQVYANRYGSRLIPEDGAVPVTEAERAEQGLERKPGSAAPTASPAGEPLLAGRASGWVAHTAKPPEPDYLPEPKPSILVISALFATLVGFISGMVVKRGPRS